MNPKIEALIAELDIYKDIKLNFSTLLNSSSVLTEKQIVSISLACSVALKNPKMVEAFESLAKEKLSDIEISGAKNAAIIMGMNNIYYRTTHLLENKEYSKMQSGLRMNVMANHGIDAIDFELYSFAVSVLNGCGMCLDSHEIKLLKHGFTTQQVQYAIRLPAVLNAVSYVIR
jgi:alkyl hydroperoxide reductase subunit D